MSPVGRIARTYRAAFAGLPRGAWLISGVVFVNRSGTMVLPFLVLFLTRERGYSVAEAGRVLGMYGVGSFLGAAIGGWLSDRIGPIRTQQISLIGGGFGLLLLGEVEGDVALPLTALSVSLVNDLFRPASMTALAASCDSAVQARAFALMRLALNLGMAIGPAIGGFLARANYAWIFRCDAATSFAAAAILFWLHGVKARADGKPDVATEDSRPPWKDRPYLALLVLVFLLACVFFQLLGTFPLYVGTHFGIDEAGFGLLLALNCLLIVAVEMVLMHAIERRERVPLAGAGAFLICLGFGLMPLSSAVGWAIFTVVVWTAGEMLALPLLNAIAADRGGAAHRGKYLGAYSTAYALAFAIAPVMGSWVYQHHGPDALWYAIAFAGVALWAGFVVVGRAFRPRTLAAEVTVRLEP